MQAITFVVKEDELDGGFTATARWSPGNRDIVTEGENREELVRNIRDAIDAAFADDEPRPQIVHLHFVRDEVVTL